MIESGPPLDDGLGYTKEAMWSWFDERGYALLIPNRVAHEDPGLSKDSFLESHLYPRRTSNYIATPREARSAAISRAREILG